MPVRAPNDKRPGPERWPAGHRTIKKRPRVGRCFMGRTADGWELPSPLRTVYCFTSNVTCCTDARQGKQTCYLMYVNFWILRVSYWNVPCFVNQLKLRLTDLYITELREGVSKSTSLTLYKEHEDNFELSQYLRKLDSFKHRQCLSKLRLSSHVLNIEQGIHRNIPRNMENVQ